ncbi:MAG: hypothetical protein DLM72_00830 [Candidatus Nitrosopolaris wilkensis]|nr:MAG: hypothetical protein DLM72_00830 [Candidatus Nitrosopolaris wilkensis]
MAKYGYRDPDTGEFIEQNQISNCIWPEPPKKHGFFCRQGHYMKLISEDGTVSRDTKPHSWRCQDKCISIEARDRAFNTHRKIAMENYNLHKLEYNHETNSFEIESAIFVGESLVHARRKQVGQTEQNSA